MPPGTNCAIMKRSAALANLATLVKMAVIPLRAKGVNIVILVNDALVFGNDHY